MKNILETELITDEQMLMIVGGRDASQTTCGGCPKVKKGDTTIEIDTSSITSKLLGNN